MNEIAKNIKKLRLEKGITQEVLASALGLFGSGTISQYESGYTVPGRSTIIKIAEFFGVTANDIIYEATNDNQRQTTARPTEPA